MSDGNETAYIGTFAVITNSFSTNPSYCFLVVETLNMSAHNLSRPLKKEIMVLDLLPVHHKGSEGD